MFNSLAVSEDGKGISFKIDDEHKELLLILEESPSFFPNDVKRKDSSEEQRMEHETVEQADADEPVKMYHDTRKARDTWFLLHSLNHLTLLPMVDLFFH